MSERAGKRENLERIRAGGRKRGRERVRERESESNYCVSQRVSLYHHGKVPTQNILRFIGVFNILSGFGK